MSTEVAKTSKFNMWLKSVGKFFKEVRAELKRVIWPTPNQLVTNTIAVLVVCLLIGAVIWIADFGLAWLFELVIGKR